MRDCSCILSRNLFDATHEFLPGDNKELLNQIELQQLFVQHSDETPYPGSY